MSRRRPHGERLTRNTLASPNSMRSSSVLAVVNNDADAIRLVTEMGNAPDKPAFDLGGEVTNVREFLVVVIETSS